MANERIQLNMSVDMAILDIIMTMGDDDNPGALTTTCAELLSNSKMVDPDAFADELRLSTLSALDTLGICGKHIYMLWRDVCERDIGKMIAVLHAYQLGQLAGVDAKTLNHAINNRGAGIDLIAVVKAVQSHIQNFNPETVAT